MLPTAELGRPWALEELDGITVLRLRAPPTKEIGYVRRTWNEFVMPFAMLRNLRKSPLAGRRWDGIVWYAPSIFHGPMASALKRESGCKGYLIIRDIFPEWAVDMGLMGRGLPYRFFDSIARYQYSVADVIGVQTPGNLVYFDRWRRKSGRVVEVLQNWLGKPSNVRCSIRISETPLAGRKLFVYAGNMGVAQSVGIVLDLAQRMASRADVGFVLVGRGSEAQRLREKAQACGLTNVVFFDEIHPDEIPDLYAQCRIGIVSLDLRHRSHNIPGKFLTYMQNGLPVLARLNPGNDLAQLIRNERVGEECQSDQLDELAAKAKRLLAQIETDADLPGRCRRLFDRQFSVEQAVSQIAEALSRR
ncbi:glycosyltransferase family 4 protein [Mesorhizobium sp. 128a]